MSVEFCDTNVLVYAHDLTAGVKREAARTLLERLVTSGKGAVSIQVLQELFVTLTRKVARPLPAHDARAIAADFVSWRVFAPDVPDVLAAIDASARWQVSFWDAMLLVAANRSAATILWSEDLNDGQTYDAVVVRNPFRAHATR